MCTSRLNTVATTYLSKSTHVAMYVAMCFIIRISPIYYICALILYSYLMQLQLVQYSTVNCVAIYIAFINIAMQQSNKPNRFCIALTEQEMAGYHYMNRCIRCIQIRLFFSGPVKMYVCMYVLGGGYMQTCSYVSIAKCMHKHYKLCYPH